MSESLSRIRLYAMRLLYLLNFLALGADVWPAILHHTKPWDPLHGVAFSFWAALSLLSLWGVRFPVKLLPLLLLQFSYKVIWLLAVAYPLWSAGQLDPVARELITACGIGALLDLVIIPWPYVFEHYVKAAFKRDLVSRPQST